MFLQSFHLTPETSVPEHQLNTSVPEALENPQEETWAAELQAENSPSAHMQRIHSLATGEHGGSSPDKSSQVSIRRCRLTSLLQACRTCRRVSFLCIVPVGLSACFGARTFHTIFPNGSIHSGAISHLLCGEARFNTVWFRRHCFGPATLLWSGSIRSERWMEGQIGRTICLIPERSMNGHNVAGQIV